MVIGDHGANNIRQIILKSDQYPLDQVTSLKIDVPDVPMSLLLSVHHVRHDSHNIMHIVAPSLPQAMTMYLQLIFSLTLRLKSFLLKILTDKIVTINLKEASREWYKLADIFSEKFR